MLRLNEGTDQRFRRIRLMTAILLLGCCMVAQSARRSASPASRQPSAVGTDLSPTASQICSQIQKGNLVGARELLTRIGGSQDQGITYLENIVSKYEAIERQRRADRQKMYQQQLGELYALRSRHKAHDVADVGQALEAIVTTAAFADHEQKQALLNEPFVKLVIGKAIDESGQCEAQGKWLDAYTNYYVRLQSLDPNNKAHADHARQLADRADIVASLRDSPCETTTQRYAGIKRQSFTTAIRNLDSNYVVRISDYRQMATKAVKRCKLLAEVASRQFSDESTSANIFSLINKMDNRSPLLDIGESDDWSPAMDEILQQLSRSSGPLTIGNFVDVFESVLALNAATVKLPEQIMIYHFAAGALSALDRYTTIVWPSQVADFKKNLNGRFSGIGISFLSEENLWTVSSLLPDTPAYKSGLDVGDVIEAVDGAPTKDMAVDCMVSSISDPAGTDVTLTVRRTGTSSAKNITITRAPITLPSVCGWQRTDQGQWLYMIDNSEKIGFVRLTGFNDKTVADLEKALVLLETEGLEGLILDLRSNLGGVVNAAAGVVDRFVEKGIIVSTRPRYGMSTYLSAHRENTHPNYPIVVLVDRISASAAEIVAGALQDARHSRGVLVGERTLGKGSVQTVVPLPGDAMLKYTMAHYHLPSGRTVESRNLVENASSKNWGIKPDVNVELTKDEQKTIAQIQRSNAALTKGRPDNVSTPVKRYSTRETIDADPQLAIGLLVLKSKMLRANHPLAMN